MELVMSMRTFPMDTIAIARINLQDGIVNITLCVKMEEAVKMELHVGWIRKHPNLIAIVCLDTWERNAILVSSRSMILIRCEERFLYIFTFITKFYH